MNITPEEIYDLIKPVLDEVHARLRQHDDSRSPEWHRMWLAKQHLLYALVDVTPWERAVVGFEPYAEGEKEFTVPAWVRKHDLWNGFEVPYLTDAAMETLSAHSRQTWKDMDGVYMYIDRDERGNWCAVYIDDQDGTEHRSELMTAMVPADDPEYTHETAWNVSLGLTWLRFDEENA